MQGFRGTVTNRIDAKGRVSVPARFRAVIDGDGMSGIICYRSLTHDRVIDAGGRRLMDDVDAMIARLDPYSDECESLSHALLGGSDELTLDRDGRITLPESLREITGITDAVTFVGLGVRFQLWEPAAWDDQYDKARKQARDHRGLLRSPRGNATPGGDS